MHVVAQLLSDIPQHRDVLGDSSGEWGFVSIVKGTAVDAKVVFLRNTLVQRLPPTAIGGLAEHFGHISVEVLACVLNIVQPFPVA